MTASAEEAQDDLGQDLMTRPGSLTSPFGRHWLIFLAGISATHLVGSRMPAQQEPVIWLVGAAVLGILTAVVARGWLGLVFLPIGLALGLLLELHLRLGPGSAAARELSSNGGTYLAALVVVLLAYAAVLLGMWLLGRRRRPLS